jgi:hypothetical protein
MQLDAHIRTEKNGTLTLVFTGLNNGMILAAHNAFKDRAKVSTLSHELLSVLDYEINQHPDLKELVSAKE